MKSKSKLLETRTLIIILILIIIIGGGYLIISNLPAEEDYLTPEEVLANIDSYMNKKITVRGFYDLSSGADPIIVSTLSTTEGRAELRIDYSNIENATDDLFEEEKYDFTGELFKDTPTGFDVILILDDFKEV